MHYRGHPKSGQVTTDGFRRLIHIMNCDDCQVMSYPKLNVSRYSWELLLRSGPDRNRPDWRGRGRVRSPSHRYDDGSGQVVSGQLLTGTETGLGRRPGWSSSAGRAWRRLLVGGRLESMAASTQTRPDARRTSLAVTHRGQHRQHRAERAPGAWVRISP